MVDLERQLENVGIKLNDQLVEQTQSIEMYSGFSGYGLFTPITVNSVTTEKNANLERDK